MIQEYTIDNTPDDHLQRMVDSQNSYGITIFHVRGFEIHGGGAGPNVPKDIIDWVKGLPEEKIFQLREFTTLLKLADLLARASFNNQSVGDYALKQAMENGLHQASDYIGGTIALMEPFLSLPFDSLSWQTFVTDETPLSIEEQSWL